MFERGKNKFKDYKFEIFSKKKNATNKVPGATQECASAGQNV